MYIMRGRVCGRVQGVAIGGGFSEDPLGGLPQGVT